MKFLFAVVVLLLPICSTTRAQNVGIGTLNPQFPLDVHTPDNGTVLRLRTTKDSIGASTLLRFTTATNLLFPDDRSSFMGSLRTGAGTNLLFATASNGQAAFEKMRLNYLGNLGLGTLDPQARIHIDLSESALTNAILINNDTREAIIQFQRERTEVGFLQSSAADLRIGTNADNTNGLFAVRTGGFNRLIVRHNGNVGIGAALPQAALHVMSGTEATLNTNGFFQLGATGAANLVMDDNEIQARSDGAASILYLQNSGGNVRIGNGNFLTAHRLGVAGDVVVTGNLRVGETVLPPGYTFGVDGRMICTEVMVRLVNTWPDYVFDPSYKLRSLYEVEQFIKINNHLPGIPKAAEVEQGLSLGEMQKMQMEKIEELTLYIIALKKEVDALRATKK